MNDRHWTEAEVSLLRSPQGVFNESELTGLPEAAAKFLRRAIAPGTPLALSAGITMTGRIKIGRWVPFRAQELLTPHDGFVWTARAAGVVSGSDRFVAGKGAMNWRLFGLIPVMRSAGPDVSRSAAERAAAEAIWLPTSLLPRYGVEWSAPTSDRLCARYRIADHPVEIGFTLGTGGLIDTVTFQRWGDPDGTGEFGLHAFGGEFTDHGGFGGVTIPVEGRLGWHYGSDRWAEGEFFRYRITDLELVTDGDG